jgi:repressor of nif and glnA expression
MVNGDTHDAISREVLKVINESSEPLETKEVEEAVKKKIRSITRTKIFYRLMVLHGKNLVHGKFVGPGKGVWIWWKCEVKK